MKKRIISFLLILVMAVSFIPTLYVANAATYGVLEYEIADGEVTITSCNTSATTVTIPSEIEGYPVTAIGDDAFSYCESLANITIPDSVTTIGYYAFVHCQSLESIAIPDSVTSIGELAFSRCDSLVDIAIPDSVITIGDGAFFGCSGIQDSEGFVIISDVLYYYGGDLTNITIPDGVTTIGGSAFIDCESLTNITIPDSVTSIGEWAFSYCDLESIIIPDSVTSIGGGAFYNCESLESITIGDGVTTIGYDAFCRCSSLENITIPNSVTTIGSHAFRGCKNLISVIIGNSVTSIGKFVFYGCESLASVTIGDSVISIGHFAFDNCDSLETVYYHGTEQDRANIWIDDSGNARFLNATWNYHEYKYDNACDITCNICGATRTITHAYGEYASDNNATTEKDGTKTRVCSVCGAKDTVTDGGSKLPTPEPKPEEKPEEKPVEIKDTTKIFTDVKAKKWYTNAVNYAYSHGFIAGVSDTEFGRDVPVTRGMFITILARIAGVDTSSKANKVTTKFTDVKSGKYYTNAIKWASENGVVNGLTDTTFGPNNAIERQQLCTMIVNFAKYMKIDLKATQTEIKFADATSIRKYAKNAVATCQKAGVVSGYAVDGGTEFKPLNTATRAEAAQILYKFHKDFVA